MGSIQDRVAVRRRQLGMTQRDLAKKIGWTEQTLSRRLRDPERLRLDQLRELADGLDVSLSVLLRGGVTLRELQHLEAVSA